MIGMEKFGLMVNLLIGETLKFIYSHTHFIMVQRFLRVIGHMRGKFFVYLHVIKSF